MGKCKEVEEWLMGSGDTGLTGQMTGTGNTMSIKEPNDDEENHEKSNDAEQWMFKTFSRNQIAKPGGDKEQRPNSKASMSESMGGMDSESDDEVDIFGDIKGTTKVQEPEP